MFLCFFLFSCSVDVKHHFIDTVKEKTELAWTGDDFKSDQHVNDGLEVCLISMTKCYLQSPANNLPYSVVDVFEVFLCILFLF